jgi:hypothetical protein
VLDSASQAGLIAWYDASSFNVTAQKWYSLLDATKYAPVVGSAATYKTDLANSGPGNTCDVDYVAGVGFGASAGTTLTWPETLTSVPAQTICTVARYPTGTGPYYTSAYQKRIFTGTSGNYALGHWNTYVGDVMLTSTGGTVRQNSMVTSAVVTTNATELAAARLKWAFVCVAFNTVGGSIYSLGNGGYPVTIASSSVTTTDHMTINAGAQSAAEYVGPWAAAELLVWNRMMSPDEIALVSAYLAAKYCLTSFAPRSPPPPSPPPPSPPSPRPPPPSAPAVCITSAADGLANFQAGSRTLYCKTTSNAGCSAGVVALAAFQSSTLSSCAAACDAAVVCAGFSFTSTLACQLQSSGMPTGGAQPSLSGACFNTLPGEVQDTLACPAGTFLAGQSCYYCPIGALLGNCMRARGWFTCFAARRLACRQSA